MFNSKSVHLMVLGLIIGSAGAYVYGSYQIEVTRRAAAEELRASFESNPTGDLNPEDMGALFEAALAADPENPELMSRYATLLFDLGRYGDAVEWFRNSLERQPENTTLRTALAASLFELGQIDDALAEYDRAIAADPSLVYARHGKLIVYLEALNDVAQAESILREIEQIDPTYPGLPAIRARIQAAR